MDEKQLQEIRARVEEASDGPWWLEETTTGSGKYEMVCKDGGLVVAIADEMFNEYDSDFVIRARTDIPDLLAEVERLRLERKERGVLKLILTMCPTRLPFRTRDELERAILNIDAFVQDTLSDQANE